MKSSLDIKGDFPIFMGDWNTAYLDNSATTQKPKCVIDAVSSYYKTSNANPHRGVYKQSIFSSYLLGSARHTVAKFLNSESDESIIFTKNATESLNLLAYSYGMENVKKGDNIVLSILEHHSNLVPWQFVAKKCGAELKYMYLDDTLNIPDRELNKIDVNTKIVCVTAGSNVLGTITDIKRIVKKAHEIGAVVVCDITQYIPHLPFDTQSLDVDFAVFSGHKIYAPTGVGVLYGKTSLLDKMPPFLFGGDMIEYVTEQDATFSSLPNKFEAGTIDLGAIVGLERALEYFTAIGYDNVKKIETELFKYAVSELKKLNFLDLYIPSGETLPVLSFNVKGIHPHDVTSILDLECVAVRGGNHCAQPLIDFLGLPGTCRLSLAIYNTKEDIDMFVAGLKVVYTKFEKVIAKISNK